MNSAMQSKENQEDKDNSQFYLYENFNICAWYVKQITTVPVIGKIQNALVAALNDFPHLPKYIFIVPDKDIIQDIGHYDDGVKKAMFDNLNWLTKQIGRCITQHREELKKCKPGSVAAEVPRVIWVSMLARPISDDPFFTKIWKISRKFNQVLEDILEIENFMHIMFIQGMEELKFFDSRGDLTSAGQWQFWHNLDDQIKVLSITAQN